MVVRLFSLAAKPAVATLVGFFLGSAVLAPEVDAGTAARGFTCGTAAGVPATNAVTSSGKQIPVIRWTSSTFNDAGWSQQRRCEEVSARFDTYLKQGRLTYITTGRMNGLPVICTAPSKGSGCDGLLYTLKPGQDATSTLRNLLEIRVKARGPLNETTERLYVGLDELLETAQTNAAGGSSPASPTQATPNPQVGSGLF